MIRRFLRIILLPKFVLELPRFALSYLKSRTWLSLLTAIPAVIVTLLLVIVFASRHSASLQQNLRQRYNELSQKAFEKGDRTESELYFARLLTLTTDQQEASFRYAKQLYEKSNAATDPQVVLLSKSTDHATPPDDFAKRALGLLQSLAPRRADAAGYPPAHRFLADHFESREPPTPVTRLLTLQHRAFGHPNKKAPALDLAAFFAKHNYHQQAINTLNRWQKDQPDVQLALAAAHTHLGNHAAARRQLEAATEQLAAKLEQAPHSVETRQQLSRAFGAQGRILESLFVLAEGCRQIDDPHLADQLIRHYTIWLTDMRPEQVRRQLNSIQLALAPTFPPLADDKAFETDVIQLSSGATVSLPTPIVDFHNALLAGEGQWLVPLLMGTDEAAVGDLPAAVQLLKEATDLRPKHPVAANNLAWVLWRQAVPTDGKISTSEASAAQLKRAWQLANTAVDTCPENVSFRETRGLIAAAAGHWQVAIDDLQMCADNGMSSEDMRRTLHEAKGRLTP